MNKGTKQYKKLSMILVFALIIGLFPTGIMSAETGNSAVVSGMVQNSAIQEDITITPTIETGMVESPGVESPSIELTPQPMVPTTTPEETLAPEETITPEPTATPEGTVMPMPEPTQIPEETVVPEPTQVPETALPTPVVTAEPTVVPVPTAEPTVGPLLPPTVEPTVTPVPTAEPTVGPPLPPTVEPTVTPVPTAEPTVGPSLPPTVEPTPTPVVTAEPTEMPVPTAEPTVGPPLPPTVEPTVTPVSTEEPTAGPSLLPTVSPVSTIPPVADSTVLSNPTIQNTITTWDYVTFGHAITETGDVTTPLYWRVLSVKNGEMLLMADKTIATASYDAADHLNWKDSSVRQWMNGELMNLIFTENEQADILYTVNENSGNEFGEATDEEATLDQLFLPSMTEICREEYGFSDLLVENAMSRVCKMENGTSVDWWLRTAGYTSEQASYVTAAGSVQYTGEDKAEEKGIRPMLRIRQSSVYWRYVGKIQSDGKILLPVVATPTPVPTTSPVNVDQNTPVIVVTAAPTQAPVVTIKPTTSPKKVKKPAKVTWKKNKKKAGKKIKLSWKKVKVSKGYQVRYAKKASFKKAKTKTTNKTFITMKKQKSKYTFVQVRAYRLDGKKKVYGAWSKVKKIQWK